MPTIIIYVLDFVVNYSTNIIVANVLNQTMCSQYPYIGQPVNLATVD